MKSDLEAVRLLTRMAVMETTIAFLISAHPQEEQLRADLRRFLDEARGHALFSSLPEASLQAWDEAVERMRL